MLKLEIGKKYRTRDMRQTNSDPWAGAPPGTQFRESRRPIIVCLCGSTRFGEAFRQANLRETLAGKIVLSIADLVASGGLTEELKSKLDELHKRKIDLADEVLILNVGGYIGESTLSELNYALSEGKHVRWLEPASAYWPRF